jgi:hypothetical protein
MSEADAVVDPSRNRIVRIRIHDGSAKARFGIRHEIHERSQ